MTTFNTINNTRNSGLEDIESFFQNEDVKKVSLMAAAILGALGVLISIGIFGAGIFSANVGFIVGGAFGTIASLALVAFSITNLAPPKQQTPIEQFMSNLSANFSK